ncbi:MAG: fructose-6-phosphate aldolase [Candidatus Fraserbacteria bacterium RBG_16_55_9]|uniref:Probable transaldolase n=1 Tax=Fraserbacteria sp. (strain RBG_16_55_9) TaxID=1817864 RepID=A0A1F5V2P6_FRAXR|nr:MAG: fructose-6-phosphate aldolase [Candidatus Fraserbacteria bacterium RBG_16_55_9]
MKIFVDTANREEIEQAASWGILDGVTTNPTLLAKEMERTRKGYRQILEEICQIVNGPVNGEVVSTDSKGMVREGLELAEIHENMVVKVPMIPEGLKAVKRLRQEGIRTNVTLAFSPSQALLAAKAGATYVSPFVGRIDDKSGDGMEVVSQIVQIFQNYNLPTEVLAASLRHPVHVVEAALLGADIATMPFSVLQKLFEHPLTDIGLKQFLADWEKTKQKIVG